MGRLQKEIEFPLFTVGLIPDSKGKPFNFTRELGMSMARNSNFALQSGILQPPIRYDHPAFGATDKENHGTFKRFEFRDNSLFAYATNWSERLQADKAREARIAYSGECVEDLEYPDGNGTMKKLGPCVVGMAILGGDRPAFKNLKPLTKFEFAEGVSDVDAFEIVAELRKSGLIAETVEGTHFFGEVTNDSRRFFSEQHGTENDMDEKEFQKRLEENDAKWDKRFSEFVKTTEAKVQSFSDESQRIGKINAFCETVRTEKPIGKLALERLREAMKNPTEETVRAFVESLPAFLAPNGKAEEKAAGDKKDRDGDDKSEPEALAKVRPRTFSDPHDPAIMPAVLAFGEFKPEAFKGIESDTRAKIEKTAQYVRARDLGATAN